MKRIVPASLALILILAAGALAVIPQKWTFRTYDDFLRGKFDGISVSSDGVLTLAPREDGMESPPADFYLSFVMTPDGAAYLGTGHDGKIFRISKEGKADLYIQLPEMDVTCLALDAKGVLYAGTSPSGKIYKIAGQGKNTEFFDPSERYIWKLLFEDNGNLLAAVGERGGIYEIDPQGQGRLIHKAQENHILCLKVDKNRDIIAGSGGNGLVYRISRNGKGTALFESPFEEIRTLAFDLDGNIYAAAGGTPTKEKKEDSALPVRAAEAGVTISVSAAAPAPAGGQAGAAAPPPLKAPGASFRAAKEPGALFKIAPDGVVKRLWSSADEMVYSLYWNEPEKRVYFGTGPVGRMYTLGQDEKATLVLQKNSEQVFDLLPIGVKTYLVSNNPCQLSVLYPEQRPSGEYTSPVLDAKMIAAWGKLDWEVELPLGATCQLQTRSGIAYEPGPSWSDWSPPYQKKEGEQVLSPKGRFLQIKVLFKAQSGKTTPSLSKTNVFYLQTNVPPAISRLDVLAPNEVFLKLLDIEDSIMGQERRNPDIPTKKDDGLKYVVAKKAERKGYQTLQWAADDENGDSLVYLLSLKRDGEKDWRPLEEQWTDAVYAFNTVHFPDGIYVLKITASDRTSNPPDQEHKAEKVSSAFVIDNSAPVLKNVQAARDGNQLNVSFQAEDAFLPILEVKYLVRPGDWRVVFPEDGICDSKSESFKFKVTLEAKSDRMMTVIVKDAAGNTAVHKQIF